MLDAVLTTVERNALTVTRSALVVGSAPAEESTVLATLTAAGFAASVARNYGEAREILEIAVPHVLVTELTLGQYNGLQLVLRARAARPDLRAAVISRLHDPSLRHDAEQLGATFVPRPLPVMELSAAIARTALTEEAGRRIPIRPPFERRHHQRRQNAPIAVAADRRRSDRRRPLRSNDSPAPV